MKRDTSLDATMMELAAELHIKGASINFEANRSYKQTWCPSVPGTSWVHKRYYKNVETGFARQGSLNFRSVIGTKQDDVEMNDAKEHVLVGQRIIDPSTNTVRYTARLSTATKPFPGKHPLDGTEIIPAAVYLNTFRHTTGALLLSNVNFDVPVSLGSDEQIVSVVVKGEQISIRSAVLRSWYLFDRLVRHNYFDV
jgi:6-methylsalicylic acid synthase